MVAYLGNQDAVAVHWCETFFPILLHTIPRPPIKNVLIMRGFFYGITCFEAYFQNIVDPLGCYGIVDPSAFESLKK